MRFRLMIRPSSCMSRLTALQNTGGSLKRITRVSVLGVLGLHGGCIDANNSCDNFESLGQQ